MTLAHNGGDGIRMTRSSTSSLTVRTDRSSITHNGSTGMRQGNTSFPGTWRCNHFSVWGNVTSAPISVHVTMPIETCESWNPLYADEAGRDYAPTRFSILRGMAPGTTHAGWLPWTGALHPDLTGFVWDDLTLTQAGSPWRLAGDLVVSGVGLLSLESGARVEVAARADAMVGGDFAALTEITVRRGGRMIGPAAAPAALITSAAASPTPGDWAGIQLLDFTGTIRNARLDWAERGFLVLGPRAPALEDVESRYHRVAGVQAENVTTPVLDLLGVQLIGIGSGDGVLATNAQIQVRSSSITHHGFGDRACVLDGE